MVVVCYPPATWSHSYMHIFADIYKQENLTHGVYLQVTFEQHKDNLSRMFREYQRQESAGSVRTISGASQSMDTMESISNSPAEESAPSTVIELTVDSPSSPTSPMEPSDEAKPASITVSNILEGVGDDQQMLEGNNEPTVTQEKEEQIKEPEVSTEERRDHPQSPVCDGEGTDDSGAAKVADVSTTPVPVTDKKDESEPSNSEQSSMNEADIEAPPSSEQEGRSEMSSEATPCLENSMLGGASVVNEDLVDVSSVSDQVQPSDDDSQEESSYMTGPAGGEEPVKEEEAQHEHDVGEEVKDEEVGTDGNTEGTTPAGVTETSKDEETLEQPCTVTTPAGQTSETTTAPAVQEVEATSASDSDKQPPEVAAEEPTTSAHVDSSAAASSSGKTKEIKIARLDVSNVASDTERLELKETVRVIHLDLFTTQLIWN